MLVNGSRGRPISCFFFQTRPPRLPFYQHMSTIGWSEMTPEGSKGAPEGPQTIKFHR